MNHTTKNYLLQQQEEHELRKISNLFIRNYKFFIICLVLSMILAYLAIRFIIPIYEVSCSILIKEDSKQSSGNMTDYLNSNIFGKNLNFQNELLVLKSAPVIEQTIKNLNLTVSYNQKREFQWVDAYQEAPFRVLYSTNHVQPIGVRFVVKFEDNGGFIIKAESDKAAFYDYSKDEVVSEKKDWSFVKKDKFNNLIISNDLSFIIQLDSTKRSIDKNIEYGFIFETVNSLVEYYSKAIEFNVPDKSAQVIKLSLKTSSPLKGIALLDELVTVYSKQNLDRKNHIASISLDYIEKQLGEISDSLSNTEDNLQNFRSSYQLLDVTDQVKSISDQYVTLQNQRAELIARKRYYDYVAERIEKNDDFTNMTIPASIGISDPLLNDLMSNLISAQAQRANLIANNQEKNPLVKKLEIQIENLRRTIIDNISSVRQTTDISLSDINRRVVQASDKITSMPGTQRRLGGIERKYQLNNAIYNYLLEKRAEAQITQASNLPDNIILEPAKQQGIAPVSLNTMRIYILAFALGLGVPFGFLMIKHAFNDKITTDDSFDGLTDAPIVGKILHNKYKKTNNVMLEYPKSTIAESYRSLRTNLDYYFKGGRKATIMVTSGIQGEGKSFNAMNIAMSFAQLGRKTILLDFDFRKPTNYFNNQEDSISGLTSYLVKRSNLNDIIIKSPHDKLDYICSGPVPSDPVEIIALDETENLINSLKEKYDCVIIDTPPIAQVTDGFLLMKFTDINILVVRYDFSKKSIIKLVMKSLVQKSINNVCILMNDNRIKSDQYGYGYGYNKKK
jgi:tyrosine-protein kinase Etk/Wzc